MGVTIKFDFAAGRRPEAFVGYCAGLENHLGHLRSAKPERILGEPDLFTLACAASRSSSRPFLSGQLIYSCQATRAPHSRNILLCLQLWLLNLLTRALPMEHFASLVYFHDRLAAGCDFHFGLSCEHLPSGLNFPHVNWKQDKQLFLGFRRLLNLVLDLPDPDDVGRVRAPILEVHLAGPPEERRHYQSLCTNIAQRAENGLCLDAATVTEQITDLGERIVTWGQGHCILFNRFSGRENVVLRGPLLDKSYRHTTNLETCYRNDRASASTVCAEILSRIIELDERCALRHADAWRRFSRRGIQTPFDSIKPGEDVLFAVSQILRGQRRSRNLQSPTETAAIALGGSIAMPELPTLVRWGDIPSQAIHGEHAAREYLRVIRDQLPQRAQQFIKTQERIVENPSCFLAAVARFTTPPVVELVAPEPLILAPILGSPKNTEKQKHEPESKCVQPGVHAEPRAATEPGTPPLESVATGNHPAPGCAGADPTTRAVGGVEPILPRPPDRTVNKRGILRGPRYHTKPDAPFERRIPPSRTRKGNRATAAADLIYPEIDINAPGDVERVIQDTIAAISTEECASAVNIMYTTYLIPPPPPTNWLAPPLHPTQPLPPKLDYDNDSPLLGI